MERNVLVIGLLMLFCGSITLAQTTIITDDTNEADEVHTTFPADLDGDGDLDDDGDLDVLSASERDDTIAFHENVLTVIEFQQDDKFVTIFPVPVKDVLKIKDKQNTIWVKRIVKK